MLDRRAQLLQVLQQKKATPVQSPREDWPLTSAQLRVWLHQQQNPASCAYSEPTALRLQGPLDVGNLRAGLNRLVERHESLRTVFFLKDGEPRQRPGPFVGPELVERTLNESELECAVESFCAPPFELETGPLFRSCLYRIGEQDHVLLLVMHHLIIDGWSAHHLVKELLDDLDGASAPAVPGTTYGEYALAQRSENRSAQLAYWKQRLDGLQALNLPFPEEHPPLACRQLVFQWDDSLREQLSELARRRQCTTFSLLLLAWAIALGQWSGCQDLAVTVPLSQRPGKELENVVGLFVNTLPIRIDLGGDPTLEELVGRHWQAYSQDLAHQNCALEQVLTEKNLPYESLFSTMLNLQPVSPDAYRQGALRVTPWPSHNGCCKFPLSLNLQSLSQGGWAGRLDYPDERFSAQSMARLVGRLRRVLCLLCDQPGLPLSQIGLPEEELEALAGCEYGPPSSRPEVSLLELFQAQVAARPHAPCLLQGHEKLSYQQLDQWSDQLAWGLAGRGVGPGQRVLVCWPRDLERWVGLLAVVKVGATFVPMEADDPPEWIDRVARDCEASEVLRHSHWKGLATSEKRALRTEPGTPLALLYTSGSSGRPKAVSVDWRATLNRFHWMWQELPFAPDDVLCHRSAFGFVDALWELFGGLLAGQPTCVVSPQESVGRALERDRVTRLVTVPSLLEKLLADEPESLRGLRLVVSSGEVLSPALAQAFRSRLPSVRLLNLYGSTEVAGDVTWHEVDDSPYVPLGRPLSGCRVRLLDPRGQAVPLGSVGEIYLAGDNLALGYWSGPQERFTRDGITGERMFRSGDLGRWDDSGRLHYLGRGDRQLKLRGVRIQPEFLESFLMELEGVREAHVAIRGQQLTAYVAGSGEAESWGSQLRQRLPRTYWPDRIVTCDALPRNGRGKIDASALQPTAAPMPAQAPTSPLEARLLPLWRQHLKRPGLGVSDDFFELGGNSLSALALLLDCEREVGRKIPLTWLFEDSTIARLSERLQRESQDGPSNLVVLQAGEGVPLVLLHAMGGGLDYYQDLIASLPGREIWGLYGLEPGPGHWTLSELAERYVEELVRKHPHGPCVLLGLSLGGSIAYQMACALEAREREVKLIIVDSYAPAYYRVPESLVWNRRQRLIQRCQLQLGHLLRRIKPTQWPRFVLSKIGRREEIAVYNPLIEKMRQALAEYRPPAGQAPLRAPTLLLRANYQPPHLRDIHLGWGLYLAGPVEVRVIPGMHGTCLVEQPIVSGVAPLIRNFLGLRE